MDTIYSNLNRERILILCANLVLVTAFVFSQNSFVFADNIKIVNGIVSPPLVNTLQIERNLTRIETKEHTEAEFNEYINRKYVFGRNILYRC